MVSRGCWWCQCHAFQAVVNATVIRCSEHVFWKSLSAFLYFQTVQWCPQRSSAFCNHHHLIRPWVNSMHQITSYYFMHRNLNVRSCSQTHGRSLHVGSMDFVSSYLHLGHLIANKMDDDSDIIRRQGQFTGQVNNVICYFRILDSLVKYRSFHSFFVRVFMVVSYGICIAGSW